MGEDGPVQVVVELERTGSTISGQMAVAGAPATGFFGWLELIDHLERAVPRRSDKRHAGDRSDPGRDRPEGN
jgi:hypothetical protein